MPPEVYLSEGESEVGEGEGKRGEERESGKRIRKKVTIVPKYTDVKLQTYL